MTLDGEIAHEQEVASRPWQWWLAATALTVQTAAMLGFAAWLLYETFTVGAENDAVARGSTAFFFVLGLLLGALAVSVWRHQPWAYGGAVFVQALSLPIAWTMATGGFWPGAVALAVLATAAMVGLLSGPGRAALGR